MIAKRLNSHEFSYISYYSATSKLARRVEKGTLILKNRAKSTARVPFPLLCTLFMAESLTSIALRLAPIPSSHLVHANV